MPLALSEGQIGQLQTLREQYDHVCECVCVCQLNIDKNEKRKCVHHSTEHQYHFPLSFDLKHTCISPY